MAETTKKVSELTTAATLENSDLIMVSQGSAGSGWASLKATILMVATKIATGINFTSALQTTNKTLCGAINEIAGGGGSATLAGLTDVDVDDQTLADGQFLVYSSTDDAWVNETIASAESESF